MSILLNICIFLPIGGILGLFFIRSEKATKWVSFLSTLIVFALSLVLMANFNIAQSSTQQFLTTGNDLIPGFDLKYFIGLDGFSMLLFMLTTLFGPIIILASWHTDYKYQRGYYAMLLLLETAALGFFASLDIVLLYVFFEVSLIPMYFILGVWGGQNRIRATLKFFIYTMAGSLIMLVGLIYMGYDAGSYMQGAYFTTDWTFLSSAAYHPGLATQTWLFLAFTLAFGIKLALFPLYTWLPDAYTETPTAGTVFLASIMAKMGTYGLMFVCLPIFPNAFAKAAPYMAILAVISILLGGMLAIVQKDFKRLLAYSSFSHMGFIVLGLFALNAIALQGSIIQMINHGLSTGALFILAGMIYERLPSYQIKDFGGIASKVPVLTVLFGIAMLASLGLPGLNGFIGEFLILNGSFNSAAILSHALPILATTGVILAVCYMLWMFQRVMFGPITDTLKVKMFDLSAHEVLTIIPLLVFIVWIGVRPMDFMRYSKNEVKHVLKTSKKKRMAIRQEANQENTPQWAADIYDITPQLTSQISK
jgi:NADH-quinone oxidoreductase subunit M